MTTTAEPSVRSMRKDFNRIGFGLLAMAVGTTALQVGLGVIEPIVDLGNWFLWLTTFLPLYLVGMPLAIWIFPTVLPDTVKTGKLGAKNFCLFLLMCFPLMYGGSVIGTMLSLLLSGGQAVNAIESLAMENSLLLSLIIVVIAPICEEFLFRKQLIDRCVYYDERLAVVFSALMFGMFHMNLYQFFYAFFLGLIFGYVYLRTRCLRYSAVLHMIINFWGSVVAPQVLSMSDLDALEYAETTEQMMAALSQLAPIILYAVSLLCISIVGLIVLIIHTKKFRFENGTNELSKMQRLKAAYGNPGVILFILACMAACIYALQIF